MAGTDNLRPSEYVLTPEQGRLGGIKSGETRRRQKTMRELAAFINSLPAKELRKEDLGTLPDGEDIDINRHLEFMLKVNSLAMSGNVKAMKLWIDMMDELDKKKKELEIEKLKAEIEEMKKEKGDGATVPVFNFTFKNFGMDDGDIDDKGGKK